MTNMFKKTLIAVALAGFSTVSVAAELTAVEKTISNEYRATSDVLVYNDPAGLVLEAGANYADNDLIFLTFTGTSIDVDSLEDVVAIGAAANLNKLGSEVVSGNTRVTYRVTDATLPTTGLSTGNFIVAGGLEFASSDVTGSVLSVAFAAQTFGGFALDTGGVNRTINLLSFGEQINALEANTKFSKTISVASGRTAFDDTTTVDAAEISVAVTSFDDEVTVDAVTYTLTGNFAFASGDGTVVAECDDGVLPYAATVVGTPTASTYVFSCNHLDILNVATDGVDEVLNPTSFSVSAVVDYTGADDSATRTFAATSAGEWDLDGAKVYIPYMIYGGTAGQTLQVVNRGSQVGDISATAIVNGQSIELGVVGQTVANGTVSVANGVRDAMLGLGINLSGGNFAVALELFVNTAADDISVYSAYTRPGSPVRMLSVNDSNANGKAN